MPGAYRGRSPSRRRVLDTFSGKDFSSPRAQALHPVRIGCYHWDMPVQKLSVALEEHVADGARQAAKRRGMSLSAWLNEASVSALETDLRLEDGLAGVAELEVEDGPISAEDLAKADAILDAAGVGRRREPRRAA